MTKCTYKDCALKHLSKGFCIKHYYRNKRTGSPDIVRKEDLHGMRYTAEYRAFSKAKGRCVCETDHRYSYYGGRGIKFLYKSFNEFLKDVGIKPNPSLSIDRIDNNGNYEPGNCKWSTRSQQMNNRRAAKLSIA